MKNSARWLAIERFVLLMVLLLGSSACGALKRTDTPENALQDASTPTQSPSTRLPQQAGITLGEVQYLNSEVTPNPAIEHAIVQVLSQQGIEPAAQSQVRYYYNQIDLNDDDRPEVIVYLVSSLTCGSGGCSLLILQANGQDYRLVTEMTLVQSPILVSSQSTKGWNNLVLFVAGGGISPHYVDLPFNGRTYPTNPTLASAIPPNSTLNGTAIIADDIRSEGGILLLPTPN